MYGMPGNGKFAEYQTDSDQIDSQKVISENVEGSATPAAVVEALGAATPEEKSLAMKSIGPTGYGINVEAYRLFSDPPGDYSLAVARAIASQPSGPHVDGVPDPARGLTIVFPPGDWIVNDADLGYGNVDFVGSGRGSTFIRRTSNNPIFKATGLGYGLGGLPAGFPSVSTVRFAHMTLTSNRPGGGDYSEPLVKLQGASNVVFEHFKTDAYRCTHLYLNQVYDSRFLNTIHWHGGKSDGTPVIEITGGVGTYKHSMEIQASHMWFEGYEGPIFRNYRDQASFKATMVHLTNLKAESATTYTGPHAIFTCNNLVLDDAYFTSHQTTTDVVQLIGCRGFDVDVRVGVVSGGATPSSFVNIDADCYMGRLHLMTAEPIPSGQNLLTIANPSDPTIDVAITSSAYTINGGASLTRHVKASTLRLAPSTGAGQISIAKTGRVEWSWGNPANPSADWEEIYFRGASTAFLTFRSRGADPSTAIRDVVVNGQLMLGSAYNAVNRLRLGAHYLWVDSTGRLRIKATEPTSDTDGTIVGTQA